MYSFLIVFPLLTCFFSSPLPYHKTVALGQSPPSEEDIGDDLLTPEDLWADDAVYDDPGPNETGDGEGEQETGEDERQSQEAEERGGKEDVTSRNSKRRPVGRYGRRVKRFHLRKDAHDDFKCSRAVSRWVRSSIKEHIFPKVAEISQDGGFDWPRSCPWDPARDAFSFQEDAKTHVRPGHWECGLCKKVFKNEFYLDLHMDRKHLDGVFATPEPVCLEDYCEIFDVCSGPHRLPQGSSIPQAVAQLKQEEPACNDERLENARRLCEETANLCFPLKSKGRLLNVQLKRELCDKITCADREARRLKNQPASALIVVGLVLALVVGLLLFIVCWLIMQEEDVVAHLSPNRGQGRTHAGGAAAGLRTPQSARFRPLKDFARARPRPD
uniref:C2H2-type domain-containing protein n=1 Tax=Chromera velia CCMP2878 TaxID=1169474 RepID=A0A0G4GC81_9ALVE|mmetsp:Transcript_44254/g.87320  ORF Transcript_44254/g.87320 Transcript_44254/m.87320 type:complete len:385 (-) Transcript_44254:37-1191(-)|eukprot:Cvel_21258.t1-p1 / transcript=Cvel_21258.t1 / gene=Cvel_21258 / organism=Chromera_velia_CCMP2878 / gene_product=hypothetical protein / transcript_product=hypothetical protein / location=Cvel_scaffold1977:29002-33332(+) / protein_length=384 / sequence_SO=supercontig / SO=protein_coding / is_pseudo=false